MPNATLADQIAYWTVRVQLYDSQVGLGLLRSDAPCLIYARATLRDYMDIDGDPAPTFDTGGDPYAGCPTCGYCE